MAKGNLKRRAANFKLRIIADLTEENARLEDLIYDILTEIPETYLTGYSDWGDELKRLEQEELLKANKEN